jgi:glycosyltransferase involved in cell wall biosynthesis
VRVALLSRSTHPLHPPGGLEKAVYHLARHLEACGVKTLLFTRPATYPGRFPGEVVEIRYGSLKGLRHGRVLDRTLHYPAFAERVGRAVAERVRAGAVDLVDAQGLTALGYGRLRRRDPGLRAPLVMNPQGMEEHKTRGLKRLALRRLRRLSREAARLADRVVATDEATRDELPHHLGVDPSRVVVLPNGIDPEEIRSGTPSDAAEVAQRLIPALRDARPVLLAVGRLEAYKGFGDILDALARLHTRRGLPDAWAWVVVGEGRYLRVLRRRARGIEGLEPHVHLAGRVSEPQLHALYARADVFVHATRYEGSSLVTLEAMAHGLPVVATRAGGIPDKVIDGRTGRLVAPGDVEGLSRGLEELTGAPERRREWGAEGRAHALENFAWPVLARRTLALYEQLLRERPA